MRTFFALVFVLITFSSAIETAGSEEVSFQDLPPVVVQTIPKSGATDVDPSLSEIRVTFSKEMRPRTWAIIEAPPAAYPDHLGDVRYLSGKKTWVIEVKLSPGKTYGIWLNQWEGISEFKDLVGRLAVPYLLVF
jgi:RNA polymerase sigma-70 factor (ECF subfamily)